VALEIDINEEIILNIVEDMYELRLLNIYLGLS
jgi:hypothetical protein